MIKTHETINDPWNLAAHTTGYSYKIKGRDHHVQVFQCDDGKWRIMAAGCECVEAYKLMDVMADYDYPADALAAIVEAGVELEV